ncbi:hypothetical protein PsYK624_090980 [Phanerochaete sordida]|uniref:Uncharacterized protein n=1 Tax=Phanerochaete sordida TaxID=48140 RepID=A0A9P3GEM4_9APHY|nr:hypothetical protein PsYK624_090980 [Phanerochaete sordida]
MVCIFLQAGRGPLTPPTSIPGRATNRGTRLPPPLRPFTSMHARAGARNHRPTAGVGACRDPDPRAVPAGLPLPRPAPGATERGRPDDVHGAAHAQGGRASGGRAHAHPRRRLRGPPPIRDHARGAVARPRALLREHAAPVVHARLVARRPRARNQRAHARLAPEPGPRRPGAG